MKKNLLMLVIILAGGLISCQPGKKNGNMADQDGTMLRIETTVGDITVKLYDDTPQHRDNFIKLVKDKMYDGTLFHRVINNFMIQAGDPESKDAPKDKMLGSGDVGYTIPAEFVYPKLFHKKGALSAARLGDQVNPEKESSGCQFYIVTGQVYNEQSIAGMEQQMNQGRLQSVFYELAGQYQDEIQQMQQAGDQAGLNDLQEKLIAEAGEKITGEPEFKFTPEQIEAYTTVGGTPHLDNNYTVFGEVVDGMDVVEKIQQVETNSQDRPVEDVKIKKVILL